MFQIVNFQNTRIPRINRPKKTPKSTQMAVNSALKAPQATRDLGMARADRSAGWLPREHAEARTTTAMSVSPYAPVFPSWDWASRPFIHVRRLCLWNTPVRMRDM